MVFKLIWSSLQLARIPSLKETRSCGIILNNWHYIPCLAKNPILVHWPNTILSQYVPQKIRFVHIIPQTKEEVLVELPHVKLSTILQRNSKFLSREPLHSIMFLFQDLPTANQLSKTTSSEVTSSWNIRNPNSSKLIAKWENSKKNLERQGIAWWVK